MNEITSTRSNPFVDPSVHVWHAEVPIYLFLGGGVLSGGLLSPPAVQQVEFDSGRSECMLAAYT